MTTFNQWRLFSSSLLVVFFYTTSGQNYVDLAEVYIANTPINQFDTATNGSRIQEIGLDVTLPIQLKNNNVIITGLFAENISAKVNPTQSDLTSVSTITLKTGVQINHNKVWRGTYVLLPKISSDLKSIGPDDFQLGGVIMFKHQKEKNFAYRFGMYYNGELAGPLFVPLFGIYYLSPNQKFEANITLPFHADLNYAVKEYLKLGMNFDGFLRTYHLNEPFEGNPNNYLAKASNEVFTYAQFEFAKSIVFQAKVGYSIGRNYRIYDIQDRVTWGLSAIRFGDDRKQLNTDFKDGLIFRFRALYRFYLD